MVTIFEGYTFGVPTDWIVFPAAIIGLLVFLVIYGFFFRGGKQGETITTVEEFDSSGYLRTFHAKSDEGGHVKWDRDGKERDAKHSHPFFPEALGIRRYMVPMDGDEALNPEQLQKDFKRVRSPSGMLQEAKYWYGELRGKLSSAQALKQYWFTFLMVGATGLVSGILLDIFVLRGVHIGP